MELQRVGRDEFVKRLNNLKINKLREIARFHNLHYHISLRTKQSVIDGIIKFYDLEQADRGNQRYMKRPQILKGKNKSLQIFNDKDGNIKRYGVTLNNDYDEMLKDDVGDNLEFFRPMSVVEKPKKESKPRKPREPKKLKSIFDYNDVDKFIKDYSKSKKMMEKGK